MKLKASHIVTLLLGSGLGLLIGFFVFNRKTEENEMAQKDKPVKVVTEKIKDTVVVRKNVYIEVPVADTLADTLDLTVNTVDTLQFFQDTVLSDNEEDYLTIYEEEDRSEEDFEVITDKLLRKKTITLEIIEGSDSLDVEKVLNKDVLSFNEVLNIEFWSSPLDLTGYELSSKKLKLYGFNPDENFHARYKKGQEFIEITVGDLPLKLKKTDRFKTLYL